MKKLVIPALAAVLVSLSACSNVDPSSDISEHTVTNGTTTQKSLEQPVRSSSNEVNAN